jgi:HK97 family phage prohead protease
LDERYLADDVETFGRGRAGYERMLVDTKRIVETPQFKELASTIELLLARGCVLRESHLEQIRRVTVGDTQLERKAIKTASRVTTDLGEFSALAATWSEDRDGDQIVRGAFRKSIEHWRSSAKRIPLHWNHSPDPDNIIGSVYPASMRETAEGLFVRGKLDLENSEVARKVWPRMKDSAVSLSFGFLATDTCKRTDGIQELREIDLYEISIVSAPANPDTRILSVKSTDREEPELEPRPRVLSPEYDRIRSEARAQMLTLLGGSRPSSDPQSVLERDEKRQVRELRRECDRMRLEMSLGFDAELIERLT